jgi:hypothetical protein
VREGRVAVVTQETIKELVALEQTVMVVVVAELLMVIPIIYLVARVVLA